MIRSVVMRNVRGIRDGRLDALGPLVVLLGPNGAGKSTVLDSILVGASARPYEAAARVIQRRGGPVARRWMLWQGGTRGGAQIQVVTSAGETRTCSLRGPKPASVTGATAAGPKEEPKLSVLAGVPEVRLIEAVPRLSDVPLHTLWEQTVDLGLDFEVETALALLLPGFKGFDVVEEEGGPQLQMVFTDHTLPAALAGDGTRKLFRIALELASLPAGVVLLEEPEIHQHPVSLRLCAQMMAAAIERGLQLILTTQSLELLDALVTVLSEADLERMTLFRLVLEDGVLNATGIPGGDVAVLRRAVEEDLR